MGYYRGDYYQGDYYRGSIWSNIWGGVKGAVGGFVSGGPIGAIVGGAVGAGIKPARKPTISLPVPAGTGANPATQASGAGTFERTTVGPAGLIYSHTTGTAMVTSGGGTMSGGSQAQMAGTAMQCVPGMGMRRTHPNKSTYITRGGGTSRWPQEIIVHPRGTECVPSRRMNVANPRALRRALRRVAGFGKLAKRSRRAVSIAASSLGVRHGARRKIRR